MNPDQNTPADLPAGHQSMPISSSYELDLERKKANLASINEKKYSNPFTSNNMFSTPNPNNTNATASSSQAQSNGPSNTNFSPVKDIISKFNNTTSDTASNYSNANAPTHYPTSGSDYAYGYESVSNGTFQSNFDSGSEIDLGRVDGGGSDEDGCIQNHLNGQAVIGLGAGRAKRKSLTKKKSSERVLDAKSTLTGTAFEKAEHQGNSTCNRIFNFIDVFDFLFFKQNAYCKLIGK